MTESILVPSPNWYKVSGLTVSEDNWIVYGGPAKTLCILEPLGTNANRDLQESQIYHLHENFKAHNDRIVSVDLSPDWPKKRNILTGSVDGGIKQWVFEDSQVDKIKSTLTHDVHIKNKEEVAGVGYADNIYAITVGGFGYIVKWNLTTNIVETYHTLKNFKPVCIACSRHISMTVAVGTKQGVVFVLDLERGCNIVYKVRCQDDEIVNISWCPQYDITIKKFLNQKSKKQKSKIVGVAVCDDDKNISAIKKHLPEDSFDDSIVKSEDDMFDIYKDHASEEFGHKKYIPEDIIVRVTTEKQSDDYLDECLKLKEEILKRKFNAESSIERLVEALDKAHVDDNSQAVAISTPQPSMSNEKDNEQNTVEAVCDDNSYDFENSNSQPSTSNEKDNEQNTEVVCDETSQDDANSNTQPSTSNEKDNEQTATEVVIDTSYCHLLATISKNGNICILSKTGKILATCAAKMSNVKKNQKLKSSSTPSLLWYKPDVLLFSDNKEPLLKCNPLIVDSKNQMKYETVHSFHKRPIFCIVSNAPRKQTADDCDKDWPIWTTSQDRRLIRYSLEKDTKFIFNTCGGYVYNIAPCPYDASKVAVAIGDGSVKVLEFDSGEDNDSHLTVRKATTYWQNVQGKVLNVAWHPTRDNLLAFATAESRVGLIDTSGKAEKPARLLASVGMSGGVYSIAWGGHRALYASASGYLFLYDTSHPYQEPETVTVVVEGQKWSVAAVHRAPLEANTDSASSPREYKPALVVGSDKGGVAVLSFAPRHVVLAAVFVSSRMIYKVDWHPSQTTNSSEVSQYKNLIAVCSISKENNIVILEYVEKEDNKNQLLVWKTLVGHVNSVYSVIWNPHCEGILLSTSNDHTARVWDVSTGNCVALFGQHFSSVLTGAWVLRPGLQDVVLSGGGDCALRVWRRAAHPAGLAVYVEKPMPQPISRLEKRARDIQKLISREPRSHEDSDDCAISSAISTADKLKAKASRKFLLPITSKQMSSKCTLNSVKAMLQQYLKKMNMEGVFPENVSIDPEEDVEFLKLFGSTNDVNELLDMELKRHDESYNVEAYVNLCVLRGQIDTVVKYANKQEILCPYIISLTPCVSFKYWKDVCQLYIAQLNRLKAKGTEDKVYEKNTFGGALFRKIAMQLSVHDVKGALETLINAQLYKEAYILCRIRHMENLAEATLKQWAVHNMKSGLTLVSVVCFIAGGELLQAATALAQTKSPEALQLATELAKISGQTIFADHVSKKREVILNKISSGDAAAPSSDKTDEPASNESADQMEETLSESLSRSDDTVKESINQTEETLKELPTRFEALMSNGNK
ncbi:hypothetical protein ACJJTC_011120 [Scirpophaga incertulas]